MRPGWCKRPRGGWHFIGPRGMSLCGQWTPDPATDGPYEPRREPGPDDCRECRRWYDEEARR